MTKINRYQRLIKRLGKIFKNKEDIDDLENLIIEKTMSKDDYNKEGELNINPEDYMGYLDEVSVIMAIPKNLLIKGIIENNFMPRRVDKVDSFLNPEKDIYEGIVKGGIGIFSPELLMKILDICSCENDDGVEMTIKDNFPIRIENEDFIFFLAPREKKGE